MYLKIYSSHELRLPIYVHRSKEDIYHDGEDLNNTKMLASAPTTLTNGNSDSNHFLPDIHSLDLTFKPEMGQHNTLVLPSNLPLGSVAGKHINVSCLLSLERPRN